VYFDLNPCTLSPYEFCFFQIVPASLRSYHMDSATGLVQWKVLDIALVVTKDIHSLDNTRCTVTRMGYGMVRYPHVS